MRSGRFPWLLFSALLTAVAPASAEIYKWTGPDGKVRYSDTSPNGSAGSKPQTLKVPNDIPATPPAPSAELDRLKKATQDFEAKRRAEEGEAQRKRERAEEQKRRCDKALADVKAAEDSPAQVWNGVGGRENNFAERNGRIGMAKAAARAACQGVY